MGEVDEIGFSYPVQYGAQFTVASGQNCPFSCIFAQNHLPISSKTSFFGQNEAIK